MPNVEDRIAGVYLFMNIINHDSYVGSSVNIHRRFLDHFKCLRGNYHHNDRFQKSFNKYGESAFIYGILEPVSDVTRLTDVEQYWIDKLNPSLNFVRLVTPVAHGYTASNEARQHMSAAQKKAWSDERRDAWSKFKTGKPSPRRGVKVLDSSRDALSKTQTGRTTPIVLRSPDGVIHSFYNLARFCEEQNLNRRQMRWFLYGKASKRYKAEFGWKVVSI